jgi:hypothetical protein
MGSDLLPYARELMVTVLANLELKLALYDGIVPSNYSTQSEVAAPGYEAGGKSIELDAEDDALSFKAVVWPDSSITASGALIYDVKTGKGLIRSAFSAETSVRDEFEIGLEVESLVELV